MRNVAPVIFIPLLLGLCCTAAAQDPPPAAETDSVVSSVETGTYHKEGTTFSPIRQTVPVEIKKVPQEKVESLQRSDDYWYANLPPKEEEPVAEIKPRGKSLFDYEWFRNLLWILILCSFIAVVVWYLASSNISLFRKASKAIEEEAEDEVIPDDIFSINYDKEIRKAEEAANYRLAVRLWYLFTLKSLANRNLINYRAEKPNGDYVSALFQGRYYRDFFRLTRAFDYTWYGQFPLTEEDYKRMQAEFLNFKNSLA